jgi:hypothetical protein
MRFVQPILAIFALAMPVMAQADPITHDCDTAAGHFSELLLPRPRGLRVTGHLQINQIPPF